MADHGFDADAEPTSRGATDSRLVALTAPASFGGTQFASLRSAGLTLTASRCEVDALSTTPVMLIRTPGTMVIGRGPPPISWIEIGRCVPVTAVSCVPEEAETTVTTLMAKGQSMACGTSTWESDGGGGQGGGFGDVWSAFSPVGGAVSPAVGGAAVSMPSVGWTASDAGGGAGVVIGAVTGCWAIVDAAGAAVADVGGDNAGMVVDASVRCEVDGLCAPVVGAWA